MNKKSILEILENDSGSVASVLDVLQELCTELRLEKTEEWENLTLLQFLEAMHAWLSSVGPRIGERPSWKLLEQMIIAAKIYE